MVTVEIAGRRIGPGARCFVIAEGGVNHNGDMRLARGLVEAAASAGVDAIKFQTFDPAALAAADAPKAQYQQERDSSGSQRSMLEKLVLSEAQHFELKQLAESLGLLFLSTPFEEKSADFLERLGLPAFKIPSGELTNHPFIAHVARKGLPMLMSTGMATLAEVKAAVAALRAARPVPLALFHCVSSYPAAAADCNLRAMATLRRELDVPVGWSDHSSGINLSIAAVALGAELIEKHLTLDRTLPGPDHAASLEPKEFLELVKGIREVEASLGNGEKVPVAAEVAIAAVARKSLHWAATLPKGATVRREHLVSLRPGTGVPPMQFELLVGREVARPTVAGRQLSLDDLVASGS